MTVPPQDHQPPQNQPPHNQPPHNQPPHNQPQWQPTPQPPQQGWPAAPPSGGEQGALDAKGFFGALFDYKFHTLITPKIVSIVYLVGLVLIGMSWLVALVSAFSIEPTLGLGVLLVGPVVGIVYLAFWRMTLEIFVAIVRMSDDIHRSSGAPRR